MLRQLIEDAMHDGKITSDQLMDMICEELDEDAKRELYREIYEHSYGSRLNEKSAKSWVKSMAVTDKSGALDGEHWTESETYAVGQKLAIDWNKINRWEWYAVMNMMYSDYYDTAVSFGLQDKPEFFAKLAKDFVKDVDSSDGKVYRYYMDVV